MIKSRKHRTHKLKLGKKINKTTENNHENLSDKENDIFSDSSLELFDTFKPKEKTKMNSKKKSNPNVILDTIDLTNESYLGFKNIEKNIIKKKDSLKYVFNSNSSMNDISSNESFKSATSSFSSPNNTYQDLANCNTSPIKVIHSRNTGIILSNSTKRFSKLECNDTSSALIHVEGKNSEFQNNYTTPKVKSIQASDLSESAKLLDRIYGNDWRHIDGVIKDSNKKHLSDELFEHFDEMYDENESNRNYNEIKKASLESPTKSCNYLHNKDIQKEVNDTSIILENISLSSDIDNLTNKNINIDSTAVTDSQVKFNKSNTFSENDNKKESYLTAKLSFLSSLSCFTGSMKCDPAAEKYKTKFKKNKDDLVSVLFILFNKEVFDNKLPADMNFKWNARLRSTAGACFNKRSVKINENLDCERISRIELSSKIIDTAERLRDTLIHELCHAACWIFNGISEGHGPSWKSWANKAMSKFPELPIIKRCHSYDIQTKFTYKCIKCGYSIGRHSKSLNLDRKRCGYCYGEFELIVNKANNQKASNNLPVVYTDPLTQLYNLNDVQPTPKPPKKPSKFALFVKENYGRVKRENILSKHGEIMKLLGSQYATTKMLTPDEIFDQLLD